MNYEEIVENAKKQFLELKEELLNEDRRCLGGSSEEEYSEDGKKILITVDGYWEDCDGWFEWIASDKDGIIETGTVYL